MRAKPRLPSGAGLVACTYQLHRGVRGKVSRPTRLAIGLFASKGFQHLGTNRPLKLVRRAWLVGPGVDPGLCGFALAALLEALQ